MKYKIEITSKAETRTGKNIETGREWSITTQDAYLHGSQKYPTLISFAVDGAENQYPLGFYSIDESNFLSVGSYGRLELVRYPDLISEK